MRSRLIASIVLFAIAFAAGCAKKVDDAAVITNIKAQMFSDAKLTGAHLQLTSSNGQVTLTGRVPSDAARLDAYKIAAQTPGVTKVIDQMTVEAALQAPAQEFASAKPPAPATTPAKQEKHHTDRPKREPPPPTMRVVENPNPTPDQVAPPPQIPDAAATVAPAIPVPSPTPPPPPPKEVVVPANSTMTIRMIDTVDSSVNKAGEIFHASLDSPILVDNDVAVPAGADVYVRLANATSAGHMAGKSELRLELVKLEFQGQSYPLVSGTYSLAGNSRGKDTAKKVGTGAVLGTLIGAIAGGGKGAAIGAAAGAGAGGVYQASTSGKQVKVPSETKLDFQLEQPVTVTVMPQTSASN
jgi:BON domain